MCADIANFYLNNPMERYEYMKLTLDIIPEKLSNNTTSEIWNTKVMYVWKSKKACMSYPKKEKIANDKLKIHLAKFG